MRKFKVTLSKTIVVNEADIINTPLFSDGGVFLEDALVQAAIKRAVELSKESEYAARVEKFD